MNAFLLQWHKISWQGEKVIFDLKSSLILSSLYDASHSSASGLLLGHFWLYALQMLPLRLTCFMMLPLFSSCLNSCSSSSKRNCKDKSCCASFSSVKSCTEHSTNETLEGHCGGFFFAIVQYNHLLAVLMLDTYKSEWIWMNMNSGLKFPSSK